MANTNTTGIMKPSIDNAVHGLLDELWVDYNPGSGGTGCPIHV